MQDPTNSIRNIIFDLGGVLLNIDYSLLIKSFSKIGIDNFEEHFSKASQDKLFDLYEKGQISSAEFRASIRKICKPNTTDAEIDSAWNSMLLDFPPQRLQFLSSIKGRYRTFLLSNTNEIHMNFIHDYLHSTFGVPDFSPFFEKVYLSYEVGLRKPDPAIFSLVLSENNLDPQHTLFIDDSPQHLKGATATGLQTLWLDVKSTDIISELKKFGICG